MAKWNSSKGGSVNKITMGPQKWSTLGGEGTTRETE
jgi:hypothetical protein